MRLSEQQSHSGSHGMDRESLKITVSIQPCVLSTKTSGYIHSLIPRPCGKRKDGRVLTACACTNIGKIVRFTLWIYVDHIWTKYSRCNLCTCTCPQSDCKALLSNHSEVQPKYSTAFFSDVWVQEDWSSHTREYFPCLSKTITINQHVWPLLCRQSGGLKQKLKDLRSGLAQHWQVSRYSTCMTNHFLTCCLLIIWKWIGHIRTNFTDRLQTYMDSWVFLGMNAHAQAVNTRLSFH